MPPIGKRIIKSAVAVFICLCIDILRDHQGMPFYAAVAAILCVQPYVSNSVQVALNRVTGTFIGGIYGIIFLLLERRFIIEDIIIIQYLLVSFFVVLVIYTTVAVRKNEAAYISCVVFLGIVLTRREDVHVYAFALNRMLDTLIGIAVALIVNASDTWRKRDNKTLYVIHLDHMLIEEGRLSPYAVIKIKQLIERGANIALMTREDQCTIMPYIAEVRLRNPLICMNGAIIYDREKKTYVMKKDLSVEATHKVVETLEKWDVFYTIYSCRHDFLYIYYRDAETQAEEKLLSGMTETYHNHYVKRNISKEFAAFAYHVLVDKGKLRGLKETLEHASYSDEIQMIESECEEDTKYVLLRIYRHDVSEESAAKYLQQQLGKKYSLIFGSVEKVASQKDMFRTIERVYHNKW